MIEEGKLGDVKMYEVYFDCYCLVVWDCWRENEGSGLGVFYDLGFYLID